MAKKRHYEFFEKERTQLIEGTVISFDRTFSIMVVRPDTPGLEAAPDVRIPYGRTSSLAPEARSLGHGVTKASIDTQCVVLTGDLRRIPRRGEKVLMRLLYVGTDGWRCLAWTFLKLKEAVDVINDLSYSKVRAEKLGNP